MEPLYVVCDPPVKGFDRVIVGAVGIPSSAISGSLNWMAVTFSPVSKRLGFLRKFYIEHLLVTGCKILGTYSVPVPASLTLPGTSLTYKENGVTVTITDPETATLKEIYDRYEMVVQSVIQAASKRTNLKLDPRTLMRTIAESSPGELATTKKRDLLRFLTWFLGGGLVRDVKETDVEIVNGEVHIFGRSLRAVLEKFEDTRTINEKLISTNSFIDLVADHPEIRRLATYLGHSNLRDLLRDTLFLSVFVSRFMGKLSDIKEALMSFLMDRPISIVFDDPDPSEIVVEFVLDESAILSTTSLATTIIVSGRPVSLTERGLVATLGDILNEWRKKKWLMRYTALYRRYGSLFEDVFEEIVRRVYAHRAEDDHSLRNLVSGLKKVLRVYLRVSDKIVLSPDEAEVINRVKPSIHELSDYISIVDKAIHQYRKTLRKISILRGFMKQPVPTAQRIPA